MSTVPTAARPGQQHRRCTAEFGCPWRGPAEHCPFHAVSWPQDFTRLAALMSARPFASVVEREAT
jgi:hypothetical protein